MDKAVKMGKASATGSFQLFIGQIASTIALAFGSILVGIYIGQGDLGLYTIALVPISSFLLFVDWGVGSAMTKYCATYRAEKMEGALRRLIIAGLTFMATIGLALTIISLLMANFIASTIFNSPESTFLITLASTSIFFTAIYSASRSIFVGFERMKLATITIIVLATVQGLLSPLLVYLGFGAVGAIVGFTLASIASSVVAATLLYFAIIRKLPLDSMDKPKMFQTLKPLLHYGIPLSISTIINGISLQVSQFVMASFVDVVMIGNYKIATNFAVFLTFFIYPIQTVLFPAFSKIDPLRDKQLLKTIFASSVKYSSLFLAPAIIAVMFLSVPLISTIYGAKWPFAPFFLTIAIAGNLFVLLGNLSINRLLYATGETKFLMKMAALTLFIDVPLAFLLIPSLGITGLIITGLASAAPTLVVRIYWTWQRYEVKADLRNSAKIFFASIIAGVTTYMFLINFVAASWIMLSAGAVLFLVVYLISIPIVGAINKMDINNLRVMFSELGPVSKLLEIPLKLIEKPLIFKEKILS